MAGVAFGSAALGGTFSLAAAGYQTSAGFAARHEIAHAQQIEITRRYISEFEDAYMRGEVSEYDWRQYTDLRERAKRTEKVYEDSINAYKQVSTCNVIRKWRLKCLVRTMKKELRQSNRLLRSHYDDWQLSSTASDESSMLAEYGSTPCSRAGYRVDDDARISLWATDIGGSLIDLHAGHVLKVHDENDFSGFREKSEIDEEAATQFEDAEEAVSGEFNSEGLRLRHYLYTY